MSYAKTFILGNLTRDPELRVTPKGTAICAFSIAVSRKFKPEGGAEQEEVSFFECEAWGKTGENIAKFFAKGKPIFIDCRPKQDTWEDKETKKQRSKIKFVVNEFQFAGGDKTADRGGQQAAPKAAPPAGSQTPAAKENPDEDVTF